VTVIKAPTTAEIFAEDTPDSFEEKALQVFRYQARECPVYSRYVSLMGIDPLTVRAVGAIPFMPVSFFRDHTVISGGGTPETVFISSGTTGQAQSRHHVISLALYEESFTRTFRRFYGEPSDYVVMGLLPSYLEREGSSLIYMVKRLAELSGNSYGGFFLNDYGSLPDSVARARDAGLRVLLIGVTYALLDLAEDYSPDLEDVIVMETGGMKGRRKEMIREELHTILKKAFNVSSIHSEYGMTELLSQAYSKGDGLFSTPPWMKVLIRDSHDPLSHTAEAGAGGGISIIDLANVRSCSFIATADLGRLHEGGTFEVLGRFDNADIRGCNLMVS
jgi:phenylacetate-coenzyme A ligase PaaK-like adenylate-forming protein